MNFFQQKRAAPGQRARQIQSAWALRALIVGAVLAGMVLVGVVLAPKPKPPAIAIDANPHLSHQYSMGTEAKQWEAAVKATDAAFSVYLKRDQVHPDIQAITREFAQIRNEADLLQVFQMLTTASQDSYIGLMTNEEYQDRIARLGGAKIGIDMEVSWDAGNKLIKISRVGPAVEKEGARVGDVVLTVEGEELPNDPAQGPQIQQAINKILQRPMLHSRLNFGVRRGKDALNLRLSSTVIARVAPFAVEEMVHPLTNKKMAGVKTITFHHLRSATVLADLYQELHMMQEAKVRGIAIDLRELFEGDTETAVRIAAMFLQRGVLSRVIQTTPEGTLLVKTYEIVDGRVQVKTQGPYLVGADGKVSEKAEAPDKVEVTDWPANVFQGQTVAVFGRNTSGCGEVIAAAFSHSWRTDKTRGETVAKFYSWGKGTQVTYFPVGHKYWLRLSTAFVLQPDGREIEGQVGPGPNVACPTNQDEWWVTRHTLFVRMSVVPRPVWPKELN